MALLDVRDLKIAFYDTTPPTEVVKGISFSLEEGETLGIVGESGSGKTQTALSILHLLKENSAVSGGEILYEGSSVAHASSQDLQRIRGKEISMIFQEPSAALNPVMTVGTQIEETIQLHSDLSRKKAHERAIKLLDMVGIPNPEKRVNQYPFEFSGGMQQRAMIAMAMCCDPELLIADEPTTALDVTVQAQVLEQLDKLRKRTGTTLIIITHNLGIVARYADSVKIMYGGKLVEQGPTREVFRNPRHPYTMGLIRAVPRLDRPRTESLYPIEGEPPDMSQIPAQSCAFASRCKYALYRA